MVKRITFSLVCFILCLVTVFGFCSCNQKFKYDWTALDAYMEEHGEVNTWSTQHVFVGRTDDIKTITVHHEEDSDSKTVIQIVKLQENERIRYYLQFEVMYYNLIQYKTVKFEYVWFLPFDTSDKYYENRNFIEFACYKTGYESGDEYWTSLDKVGVVIDNIQLDEGQFLGCEYLFYRQYAYDKHDYYKVIELKESYDYYFNEMLTKSFSITTEFLNSNNIPSFYGFAKDMRQIIMISDDDLL